MIFDPELRLVSEADTVVQAVFYESVIKWKYWYIFVNITLNL